MEKNTTITLSSELFQDLLDILSDLYTTTPEARRLLRDISSQTGEFTAQVEELDHEFQDETEGGQE